jgi:hypothetical protein
MQPTHPGTALTRPTLEGSEWGSGLYFRIRIGLLGMPACTARAGFESKGLVLWWDIVSVTDP